jgi:hypothetical protein
MPEIAEGGEGDGWQKGWLATLQRGIENGRENERRQSEKGRE